ncbi:hypothetical protein N657DRAFT_232999 [Parathielavia appendiculata]|uniref:Uncharacterized protein n=1 Tax=Parathielavia appendiculata TaxID=2587402 RepID=A0AAN6U7H3_9PEZI|nr:hypothetical protein N657DRAFT_232999 [Parathielavia appendiculata]
MSTHHLIILRWPILSTKPDFGLDRQYRVCNPAVIPVSRQSLYSYHCCCFCGNETCMFPWSQLLTCLKARQPSSLECTASVWNGIVNCKLVRTQTSFTGLIYFRYVCMGWLAEATFSQSGMMLEVGQSCINLVHNIDSRKDVKGKPELRLAS